MYNNPDVHNSLSRIENALLTISEEQKKVARLLSELIGVNRDLRDRHLHTQAELLQVERDQLVIPILLKEIRNKQKDNFKEIAELVQQMTTVINRYAQGR